MKKVLSILLALAMIFTLAACGSKTAGSTGSEQSATKADEVIVWRVAHNQGSTHQWQLNAEMFEKLVEEKTNGRVDVQTFPDSQLGDDVALAEMIRSDSLDMHITTVGGMSRWYAPLSLISNIGVWDSFDQIEEALDGEVGELVKKGLAENGMMMFDAWLRTPYNFLSTTKFTNVAEAKGIKMRCPTVDSQITLYNALGFNATPIAFSETFTSMEQGVCEGCLNPLSSMYSMKFHEVCNYLEYGNLMYEFTVINCSQARWDALPEDIQQIMIECEAEVREYNNGLIRAEDAEVIAKMQSENPNLEVIQLNLAEWSDLAQDVNLKLVEDTNGQELWDAIMKASGK